MSFKIDTTGSLLTNLRNAPKVSGGASSDATAMPKTIGEIPPSIVSLAELGSLAALFSKGGLVSKLRRRLNKLKGKKCRVTAARGTIACIDADDLVYLGVDFLEEFQDQEDVIAGVMAQEWGHACADRPTKNDLEKLNWDEIFELRRSHEVLADEISGRMLALMDYDPKGLIKFLMRETKRTHNLKYHDSQTRADIVMHGYRDELRKMSLARELFPGGSYQNHYHSKIIDDDV